MTPCTMDDYLGAYVLRALDEDEQATVRVHLCSCDRCAAEVASLASTVSRLALLGADAVENLVTPEPDDHRAPQPASRRHARRAVLATLGAAAVAASGMGVSGLLDHWHRPSAHTTAVVQATNPRTDVHATLTVVRRDATTRLHLSLRGAYPDGTCSLIVQGRDGHVQTAARWAASPSGTAEVNATTAIPPDQLDDVAVLTASGYPLVRLVMPASTATHH